MELEEHIVRHTELHRALDELVADFIDHNSDKRLTSTSVMELIEWSSKQVLNPDENGA